MTATLYQSDYLKRKQYMSQASSIDVKREQFERSLKKNGSECKLPVKTTYQVFLFLISIELV